MDEIRVRKSHHEKVVRRCATEKFNPPESINYGDSLLLILYHHHRTTTATPPSAFPYGMAGWSVLCSFHSAGSPLGPSQLLRLPPRFHRPSFLSKHAQRLREDGTAQEERRQADKYIRTRVVTSTSMFIDVKQKLFLGTVASSPHPSI